MDVKHLFIILLMFIYSQAVICQTKNEKEERIKISAFPEMAITVLEQLPENCKRIRYYKETDNKKISYEVKFKYEKQNYSVEFSEKGILEDIEITTKFKNIEKSIRTQFSEYLNQSYTKHKIVKIQEQFIYSPETDASEFIKKVISQNPKTIHNFEIIAEVKMKNQHRVIEMLFDQHGVFLNYRTLNPTSYEHVLY